jgi:spore maturation protein CgeB
MQLDIVFLGLTLTSSWGNGHAVTYRGLVRELVRAGHRVLFLERDVPWYAAHRDLPRPEAGELALYGSLEELEALHADRVAAADLVLVGSYVPQGIDVARWVLRTATGRTAFYDIDTPVTVAALEQQRCEYLTSELVPRFDLYLSFTGGPMLRTLERRHGARRALALHCSVDPEIYRPVETPLRWELGYLGTYSADRQPALEALLLEPARALPERSFTVAGAQFPPSIVWPDNVERLEHVPPSAHPRFYCSQRYTLNVTRQDMIAAGWSPSIRLFEAAACGVPILSDAWAGLEHFFEPELELHVVRSGADVLRWLREEDDEALQARGRRARARVIAEHTAAHRARELVDHVLGIRKPRWLGAAPPDAPSPV